MEVMDNVMELQEVVNEVSVIGLDEVIGQIEEILMSINDIKDIAVLMFGFIVGYIVIRDFINNILKSI